MSHAAGSASHDPGPLADVPFVREDLEVLLRIAEVLRTIRFGTVLLVVHDGRVVQVETAGKSRLR